MFKIALIAVALAIAAVLIYAATKPDSFSIQRSATIAAPPEKIFALIDDVEAFNTWNPYNRKDPSVRLTYEGPASGPGAAYAWTSEHIGTGRMEVVEVDAPRRAAMDLAMEKPMKTTNRIEFTLEPQGENTRVTWAMRGPMPYLSKLMTTFFSMDRMVGGDFEAGLANLKAAAER